MSGAVNLTDSPSEDALPIWPPDGVRIAFESERDGDAEVYIMNADGSGQTLLSNDLNFAEDPAWSPDGLQIAFVSDLPGNSYVMNGDGTGQARLTVNSTGDLSPAWSPDGRLIAI